MNTPMSVIARVYEHIEPLDRGSRYEDPLDDVLRASRLGEVTGGGSHLGKNGEIEFADIEINIANPDDALPLIATTLERAGAPTGSEIRDTKGVLREFGTHQSVAVYLDGVSLPDDVYADLDFDALVETLTDAAGERSFHGFWQGDEETGLYFFGRDAEDMLSRIELELRSVPIGQNARLVVRPARAKSRSRTIRLPRS